MPPTKFYYIFLISLMVSLLIMPTLYNLSIRVGGIDVPDHDRKVHAMTVPRIGGIAILCGFLIAILIFCPTSRFVTGIATGGLIIFFVGFIDDLRNLSPVQKLAGQIVGASVGVILSGNHIDHLGDLFSLGNIQLPPELGVPFTIFCVVGLINSLNMIDGLDGLAGGVSAIACLTLAILAFVTGTWQILFVSAALLGSLIGFLVYNTYPARIFMGDCGSNLLGFTLGMMGVSLFNASPTISPVAILIILAVPVFDTLIVIAGRLLRGRPVMSADNTHIHHRLLKIGLGHKTSVLAVFGWSCFMAVVAVIFYNTKDFLLFLFVTSATFIFYLLLFVFLNHRSNNERRLPGATRFPITSLLSIQERLSDRLFFRSYLIIIILTITFLAMWMQLHGEARTAIMSQGRHQPILKPERASF